MSAEEPCLLPPPLLLLLLQRQRWRGHWSYWCAWYGAGGWEGSARWHVGAQLPAADGRRACIMPGAAQRMEQTHMATEQASSRWQRKRNRRVLWAEGARAHPRSGPAGLPPHHSASGRRQAV